MENSSYNTTKKLLQEKWQFKWWSNHYNYKVTFYSNERQIKHERYKNEHDLKTNKM